MAKRFLNITEKTLVSLVKKVMKRHKPPSGFRRAFFNAIRHISTGRKPYNSHGLSLLVTEDLFVAITNEFGTLDTSSAFMNVMALADEEVIEHYKHNSRAPVFVEMLNEAKEQIRSGHLVSNDWDIDTFCIFIDQYFRTHSMRFNAEHLRQALEILMSPNGYRILTVNWLLMRLITAAYVVSASRASSDRELLYSAASAAASMEDTDNGAFAALLVNADVSALREMIAAEKTCMVNLYGGVLLGSYVSEVTRSISGEFKRENDVLSRIMSACSAMLIPIGRVSMMFYCGSMFGAIIQQLAGEVPVNNTAFCVTYDEECKDGDDLPNSVCLTALQNRFNTDFTCPVPNSTTWREIVASAAQESMKMANLSAIPASMSVLVVIYLSMPLVVFSEYVSEWIVRRTASRLDKSGFVAPSKFSLYTVTGIIKLVINTFLTMTTHVSHRLFSAIINWTVTRVYFPLSLIEQPLKTTSFFNIAMSAASSTRHVRIIPNKAKCVAAALIAVPFEYTGHVLQKWQMLNGHALSLSAYAAVTVFVFVIKTARIAAMFGPILIARRQRKNLPFSSQFEKVFWYDGIRCLTAPLVLLSFEWAAGDLLRTTVVLTADSLVSYIPDMMAGSVVDSLRNTGTRLAALESWIEENFKREDIVAQLATVTAMESVPGCACGIMEKVLEKHLKKDIVEDHGMDLVLDNYGGFRESEESRRSAFLRVRKDKSKATSLADAVSADVDSALRRGALGRGSYRDISSSTESISADNHGASHGYGCRGLQHVEGRRGPTASGSLFSGECGRQASTSGIGADDTVEEYCARGNRSFAELVLHIVAMDRRKPSMRRVRKVYPSCGDDRFSFDDFRYAFDFLAGKVGIFGRGKCASEERVGLLSATDDEDVCAALINNPYVDATNVVNGPGDVGSLLERGEDLLGVYGPRLLPMSEPAHGSYLQHDDGRSRKASYPCGDYGAQQSAPDFALNFAAGPYDTLRQEPGASRGYVNRGFTPDCPPPYKSPSPGCQFVYGEPESGITTTRPVSVRCFSKRSAGAERSPLQMEDIHGNMFLQQPQEVHHVSTEGNDVFDCGFRAISRDSNTRGTSVRNGDVTPVFSELAGFRSPHGSSRRVSPRSTPASQRHMASAQTFGFGEFNDRSIVGSPRSRMVSSQCSAAVDDFCRTQQSVSGPAPVFSTLAGFRSPYGSSNRTSQRSTSTSQQHHPEAVYPVRGELVESAPVQSPSSRIAYPQCVAARVECCRTQLPDDSGVAHVFSDPSGFRSHHDGGCYASQHSSGSHAHFDGVSGRGTRPQHGSMTVEEFAANDLRHHLVHGVPCTQLSSIFSSRVDGGSVHMLG